MSTRLVTTPCVGICSSGIGDDVCRGCKRFAHEVIEWNSYTEAQREVVVDRLDTFLAQIVASKVAVVDAALVRSALLEAGRKADEDKSTLLWVHALLSALPEVVDRQSEFGFRVHAKYVGLTAGELLSRINDEFFALSKAHFERYIAPGIRAREQF